ncbi:hypothetical protein U9M48_025598 [Paspalum notatum var. saurae]|uniref:Uncharacterized protein n=1 Tax=Paspalum notatum var. saurae TaxID=547442 RepID=A0AAQ3WXI0_PASNO
MAKRRVARPGWRGEVTTEVRTVTILMDLNTPIVGKEPSSSSLSSVPRLTHEEVDICAARGTHPMPCLPPSSIHRSSPCSPLLSRIPLLPQPPPLPPSVLSSVGIGIGTSIIYISPIWTDHAVGHLLPRRRSPSGPRLRAAAGRRPTPPPSPAGVVVPIC